MADLPRLPFADAATTTLSRTAWVIEIGGVRLAMARTRETRGVLRPADPAHVTVVPSGRRAIGPLAIGAFASISAFGLLVVGAVATPRLADPAPYVLSVPVPAAARRIAPAPRRSAVRTHAQPATGEATAIAEAPSGPRFDADDEPHVAAALRTGAFQEWRDADGQPRFLTAGPARAADGQACRDLVLLIRLNGGGSHTHTTRRCTTAPIDEAPPPDAEAAPPAAEGTVD